MEIANTGIVKRTAKKSEVADFLLWSATWLLSEINEAEYPALLTAFISVLIGISAGAMMCAVSEAKFTVAVTPLIPLRVRSIAATHAEQVIPSTLSVVGSRAIVLISIEMLDHFLMDCTVGREATSMCWTRLARNGGKSSASFANNDIQSSHIPNCK